MREDMREMTDGRTSMAKKKNENVTTVVTNDSVTETMARTLSTDQTL